MSGVVYRSETRVKRLRGPVRLAYISGESEPVTFGVHGAIAERYGVTPDSFNPRATTIDYLIASAAG